MSYDPRIKRLGKNQKTAYDYIKANPGCSTSDAHSAIARANGGLVEERYWDAVEKIIKVGLVRVERDPDQRHLKTLYDALATPDKSDTDKVDALATYEELKREDARQERDLNIAARIDQMFHTHAEQFDRFLEAVTVHDVDAAESALRDVEETQRTIKAMASEKASLSADPDDGR